MDAKVFKENLSIEYRFESVFFNRLKRERIIKENDGNIFIIIIQISTSLSMF